MAAGYAGSLRPCPGSSPGWLITLVISIIVILILALVVGALGGFDWHIVIGHFHWDIGVTKS
jgi:hypothetical protein